MPNAFEDKALASEAGKKSKRGLAKNNSKLGQYIVGEGQEKALQILDELDGVEFLTFYEKLKQYYTPKKRAVESRISLEHLPGEDIEELWKRMKSE